MDFIKTDGCCCIPLRPYVFIIVAWNTFALAIDLFFDEHHNPVSIGMLVIDVIGTAGLLLGAILESYRLVAVWILMALIYCIGLPIAIFGVILDFGGFRDAMGTDDMNMALLLYFIKSIIKLFFLRIIYSYYVNIKTETQQAEFRESV